MIDLLSFDIVKHHTPFGNKSFKEHVKTGIVTSKQFSDKVELYPDANLIFVTSLENGTRINIRCNPLKPLQGHNVFGTDNVIGLGYQLIQFVLEQLGIAASAEDLRGWKQGEYKLRELHITYRFRLPSHSLLEPLTTHILRSIHTKYRPAVLKTGVGITLLSPESGAIWTLYDKLKYLQDKRHDEFEHLLALIGDEKVSEDIWERLLKAATGNLRMELRLSDQYLKTNCLDKAAKWPNGKPKEIFLQELALLRLGTVPSLESALQKLDTLKSAKPLYRTFRLWLTGDDVRKYASPATVQTHRNAIKKQMDVDILLDRPPEHLPAFDLAVLFDAKNIGPKFPSWTELYPQVAYRGSNLADVRRATSSKSPCQYPVLN